MNQDLASASRCFGLYESERIIGFCAVLHQPHPVNRRLKRCSRLVILPDWQGIGLGQKFLTLVAKHYHSIGFDFCIVTSAKNLISALRKSQSWLMYSYKRTPPSNGKIDGRRKLRSNCFSGRFMFQADKLMTNSKEPTHAV